MEHIANSAHREGDQYHSEEVVEAAGEPRRKDSDAAMAAQKAKWKRFIGNRVPRTVITPRQLGSSGTKPPLLLYGWPFKKNHFVDYAKRHDLAYRTTSNNRAALGDRDEFPFAELTDEDYQNERKMFTYRVLADHVMIEKLIKETGFHLELGRPLSLEYQSMLVLWTNYDIEQYCEVPALLGTLERGQKLIEEVMNEGLDKKDKKVKLQWWWSWDGNDVGVWDNMD